MKNNLKTKVMLAVLTGGMLCANGAYASYGVSCWYGKTGDKWTSSSGSAASSNLTLNIYDSTQNDDTLAVKVTVDYVTDYICGGYSVQPSGAVTNNTITFETTNEKIIIAEIYGGYSPNGTAGGDTHGLGNKVKIINGGTFNRNIIGGVGKSASGNEVTIEKGTFSAMNIYGGFATTGNATNNSVTIKGGTFSGGIGIYGGNSSSGNATNNTVTIEGGTFNSFQLYGGMVNAGTSSGNILNLKTKITDKAREVKYFQTMNFILPSNIAKDETMLSTEKMAFDATKTYINVDASAVTLNDGDKINLIASDNFPTGNWSAGNITGAGGTITLSGNNIVYTYSSGGDAATIKAVAEGIAASLAFVNQGADMVAGSGIDGLYVADSENPTIAAFTGSKNRYNTGSHVDIHGWNALAGVALNNKAGVSYGVFVEVGNADIDTYAALNGSGSSDYKGGGFMVRKDLGKGWNMDGAIRAGRVETSWGNNTKGGYEAKQTYYGAHVTFNKMLKEYGEQKLNGYLRYTFTHLGSDSVNLDGTHYGFDSVNSHRTRLGARMVDEGQNGFELYYGAAWEYGFGGDCDANVNGVTTSGPAVDGSNAVFEVGGTWSDKKWDISAGLEGYAGAKRGVAGGMNFVYKF